MVIDKFLRINSIAPLNSEPPNELAGKRILLYTEDHGIGGIAAFNHSLLCHLAAKGCQIICAQSERNHPLIVQQQQLGIQHLWLNFDTMKEWSRVAYNLADAKRIFSAANPDLILFSDGWPMSNFAAKHIAIQHKIPYVICLGFTQSSYASFTRNDKIPYLESVLLHYLLAEEVIAVSQENLNLLRKTFKLPATKGRVVYYGRPAAYFKPLDLTNRQRLRQELGIPQTAIVCFTAARLTSIKGYQYQMHAIAQLKHRPVWSNLYFVWAGTGEGSYPNLESLLKQAAGKLGVADQIKFLGQRWDIPDLLEMSDIFVLPSEAEGMPLAVMEAMAKGLPVIASAVSGIPEELGETGKLLPDPTLAPGETIRELVNTIEAWAVNSELRHSIGQVCKRRAEKIFTEERMLVEYETVIKAALKNDRNSDRAMTEKLSKQIELMDDRLQYNFLVWQAWYQFHQRNLQRMAEYLSESLSITPFFPLETMLHWVGSFTQASLELNQNLDIYSLSNSTEWKQLIQKISA